MHSTNKKFNSIALIITKYFYFWYINLCINWIRILSIENSLKFSHVESQPSIMREKVRIKL